MNLCIINEHFSIQFENVTLLHFETISQRLHWEKIIIFSIHSTTSICAAAAAAKLLQSCPTLCDPIDGSPPGPTVPGILQARTLEWVAISSPMHESEKWKWSHSVVSNSLWPHGLQPTRFLRPWDFPGKSTGVGCHCLLPQYLWDEFIYQKTEFSDWEICIDK